MGQAIYSKDTTVEHIPLAPVVDPLAPLAEEQVAEVHPVGRLKMEERVVTAL